MGFRGEVKIEEQVISLSEILEAVRRRWLLIVAITFLCSVIAAGVSIFIIEPTYETSTKLFVGKDESTKASYDNNDITMYQRLLKTYSETIKTKDLVNRAVNKTNYNLKPSEVLENLNIVTVADTQILKVSYKSKNPSEAVEVLESIASEFIITSKELVPNGNITVIEAIYTPEKPVSPNTKMNIAISFLLGLIISIGIVFLSEYLDNTYKSKEQLEKDLGIPVLGMIPDLDI